MSCDACALYVPIYGHCPRCAAVAVVAPRPLENDRLSPESWDNRSSLIDYDAPVAEPEPRAEDFVYLLEKFDKVACLGSLAEFCKLAWLVLRRGVDLEWGDHIEAVCWHVQQQLEDRWRAKRDPSFRMRAQDLIVNVPPRSLKSFILICANAWAWLHEPTMQIMYLSANPRLTIQSGRMFRALIASDWFRSTFTPSWQISGDEDALQDIGNTAGGFRKAKGLDGAITGEGCDWACVDDPHDVRDSVAKIQNALDGYDAAVANRVNDGARTSIRTLIMQRVGVVDMSSRWLESKWMLHLRMPMEMELSHECACGTCSPANDNAYGWRDKRREGEVLHPRFTPEFLAAERKRLREHGYATQMQQRPGARGGDRFKVASWSWHVLERQDGTVPEGDVLRRQALVRGARGGEPVVIRRRVGKSKELDLDWLCVSVDPTGGSTGDDASNLGIGVVGGKGNRAHVLEDLTEGPASWTQTLARVRAAVVRAAEIAGYQRRFTILIEKKAMGAADDAPLPSQVREMLASGDLKYPDGKPIIARLALYEPSGKGDKVQRAEAMEPDVEDGLVSVAEPAQGVNAAWVPGFVGEHEVFPRGAHDDRVDYMSQCLDHHRQGGGAVKLRDVSALKALGMR